MAKDVKFPEQGAANLGVDLSKVEGLPKKLVFGKQIFALKKGRSVVPHGHDNMCTGFIILRGEFAGKHYDRVEDNKDHYLIKPTIDRTFKPGECSTISDHKDNVHWFKAESETAFIFNIHVMGYNPDNKKTRRPRLRRSRGREDRGRADRGEEDVVGGVPQEVRVRVAGARGSHPTNPRCERRRPLPVRPAGVWKRLSALM